MEVDQPAPKRVKFEPGLSLDVLSEMIVDNPYLLRPRHLSGHNGEIGTRVYRDSSQAVVQADLPLTMARHRYKYTLCEGRVWQGTRNGRRYTIQAPQQSTCYQPPYGQRWRDTVNSSTTPQRRSAGLEDKPVRTTTGCRESVFLARTVVLTTTAVSFCTSTPHRISKR